MHYTPPLTFDPSAAQAWLHQPSDAHPGLTRAEDLGVDEELTGRGAEDFLSTVRCVLARSRTVCTSAARSAAWSSGSSPTATPATRVP